MTRGSSGAVVFVAYATRTLDLEWIPEGAEIIVVHNDDEFDRATVADHSVTHVDAVGNIGFGAAVNLALPTIAAERMLLCNPDVQLRAEHYEALVAATPDEVVTVPLVDDDGAPTSVVSAYPTPLAHVASAFRLGRFAPRSGRARHVVSQAFGRWGQAHRESLRQATGSWPLAERWVSGGVLSVDTERLTQVGGFDDRYFLYYEDVDLCGRLAARFPGSVARVADIEAGRHSVGGSGRDANRRPAERARRHSAARYAASQPGGSWRIARRLIEPTGSVEQS